MTLLGNEDMENRPCTECNKLLICRTYPLNAGLLVK